ncbi:MAG: rhomboid family intramembrane serine protease [Cyclobacteriaceae bacterium]|nr:rhomboid family intramembrane serine protease [Cyclobacteriaceae bacterium]MCH8515922.1 rhomboid family intramembrane serine protease [Cyclobacteriaceae bacterium]
MNESIKFKNSVFSVLAIIGSLWAVKILEWITSIKLNFLGVLPQSPKGLVGIFAGPFIHADLQHLISNTVPILLLGIALFYFFYNKANVILFLIYLLSGLFVWVFGRANAYHIGASGIVYGLASFLFFTSVFYRKPAASAISLIIIFLYGGMLAGILPTEDRISWEAHLGGGIVGLALAIAFRKEKITAWESNVAAQQRELEVETKPASSEIDETDENQVEPNHKGSISHTHELPYVKLKVKYQEFPHRVKDDGDEA